MTSRHVGGTLKVVVVILLLVLALCVGMVFGYRYIVGQTGRIENYQLQVEAAEAARTAEALPTPYPTETDEEGNPLPPTDENGDIIETAPLPTPTPTLEIPEGQEVVLDADSPGAVMVYVDYGDNPSDIAEQLKEKGIIENTTLFNILAKINGFGGGFQAGTHYVRKGMSFDQIMFILNQSPITVEIRFGEDFTYEDVKAALREKGVYFNEAKLDLMVKEPRDFTDYAFIRTNALMKKNADPKLLVERDNILQGYLFPDTYRFDLNADEETIIRTFLNNFENRISNLDMKRAEDFGLNLDQVLTLASIIQKESGNLEDMYKISRVFHNRLEAGDVLQSDATVNYCRVKAGKEATLFTSAEDLAIDSPYNTYQYAGLPPGPICSPSLNAIKAALYPDSKDKDIYYFVTKGDGTHAFAVDLEGHQANIDQYLTPLREEAGE